MKPTNTSARRHLLARKNYGRRQLSDYLGSLSFALSEDKTAVDLLSLEETDDLFRDYERSFRLATGGRITAYQEIWPASKKDQLESKLACFATKVAEQQVILFPRGFDYCGALRANLHAVIRNVFQLICIDKDSVQFLDTDRSNGLTLELYETLEGIDYEAYELTIWGDGWVTAIREC